MKAVTTLAAILAFGSGSMSGCASARKPPFQSLAGHEYGYRIEDSPHKWVFKVQTVLPANVDDKYAVFYGYRAVGEECLVRGFPFFDVGVNSPNELDGYCYPSKDHDALGIEFTELGLVSRPQHFIVSSLNDKTKTQLQKKDEINEIDGLPVISLAQIKAAVAKTVLAGKTMLQIKINRGDKSLTLKEPIAVFKNSSMGSDVLDLARSRVN